MLTWRIQMLNLELCACALMKLLFFRLSWIYRINISIEIEAAGSQEQCPRDPYIARPLEKVWVGAGYMRTRRLVVASWKAPVLWLSAPGRKRKNNISWSNVELMWLSGTSTLDASHTNCGWNIQYVEWEIKGVSAIQIQTEGKNFGLFSQERFASLRIWFFCVPIGLV
jgi:hypothetical protein